MLNELNIEVIPIAEVPGDGAVLLSAPTRHVVLVVDDEKVIADTLSMILSKSGYAVLTAYDGATALDLASAIPPELLITDVVMPGMTGVELAIEMTRMTPDCKVLMFSGQAITRDLLLKTRNEG
ncbi:MAG: response regulator, partial [Edaphobacter sp.]